MLTDLGLGKNSFLNWEQRGNTPSGDTVKKIADYFDVSVDYLIGSTDDPTPPNKIGREPGTLVTMMQEAGIIPTDRDITEEEFERLKELTRLFFEQQPKKGD